MNLLQDFSIKHCNTFGINAHAKFFATFSSLTELSTLLLFAEKEKLSLIVLGGGSNILFTKDFEGLILKNEINGIEIIKETDQFVFIKSGAGVNWHSFVLFCLKHDYAGVENLSLIPGSVGAAPIQNIGAYGVEVKEVLHEIEVMDIQEKSIHRLGVEECALGYRDSLFKTIWKKKYIITGVTFRLNKQPLFNTTYGAIEQELVKMGINELSIQSISKAVIRIRQSKLPDPAVIGNSGSFFKNPVVSKFRWHVLGEENPSIPSYKIDGMHYKIPAAWLIEQCGWKGYRKGDAGCHEFQPLVLVNYGNATGLEIKELSKAIIDSVEKRFGIRLEPEVNMI